MAKISGIGDYLAVDNASSGVVDISNDVTSATLNNGMDLGTVTGIDSSSVERLGLLKDASITINGVFNASSSHTVFSTLGTERSVTYAVGGNSSSNPKFTFEGLISDYNVDRSESGELTWSSTLSLASGNAAWGTV